MVPQAHGSCASLLQMDSHGNLGISFVEYVRGGIMMCVQEYGVKDKKRDGNDG